MTPDEINKAIAEKRIRSENCFGFDLSIHFIAERCPYDLGDPIETVIAGIERRLFVYEISAEKWQGKNRYVLHCQS